MQQLSGWGRFPKLKTRLEAPRDASDLAQLVATGAPLIARGNGRAYGDSAIGPQAGATVHMRHFNHLQAFDEETGQLIAEAGVSLGEIIEAFLPRGWFPAVTPGTKYVTLGGAIAADVHGKNHHRDGSFASCVDWIELLGPEGQTIRTSRTENPDLFHWTTGGMGLTGIITRAAIRLRPIESAWIRQTTIPAADLGAAMAAFEEADDATYSVAWIDCLAQGRALGRSLVMLGEHASAAELPKGRRRHPLQIPAKTKRRFPVDLPGFALNRLTVGAFNALYYRKGCRNSGDSFVDWDTYFYPLDAILGWNRIYGRKGFTQFQCALPLDSSEAGLRAILKATGLAGAGSFLAVLKRFGPQQSRFSFPMAGYTLALDFPMNARTLRLLQRLDEITLEHGGRFYLAKDARMQADTLRRSDPRVAAFETMRAETGAAAQLRSAQSDRLAL
ncbi:MAG: FAD-binding oxidoreductase [Pseudomonadota bacterium]